MAVVSNAAENAMVLNAIMLYVVPGRTWTSAGAGTSRDFKCARVDLVLNSLSDEKLQASVRCLATHGRFVEIGKFDLFQNKSLGMSVFLEDVNFHGVMLDSLLLNHPTGLAHKRQAGGVVEQQAVQFAAHSFLWSLYRSDGHI
ncbi:hypothetical protein HPB50_026359 [Hyalomma asiaticum]|uniref:Uncharacterized protein n=1 Tax=Hyalomma asiaticum TaxID=266040 RepID=A0ACB7TCJ6_HYAAI|nr:hypothetical protein HPB50_026359 [Hyalomma asiaticum]